MKQAFKPVSFVSPSVFYLFEFRPPPFCCRIAAGLKRFSNLTSL
jgi:hypothetical protein